MLELGAAEASGADTITLFTVAGSVNDDKLMLSGADFGGITFANTFNAAAGHAATAAAGTAQFVYDQMAHELWFDADGVGAGAPVELAVLNNGNFANSLFGTDFVVI